MMIPLKCRIKQQQQTSEEKKIKRYKKIWASERAGIAKMRKSKMKMSKNDKNTQKMKKKKRTYNFVAL